MHVCLFVPVVIYNKSPAVHAIHRPTENEINKVVSSIVKNNRVLSLERRTACYWSFCGYGCFYLQIL